MAFTEADKQAMDNAAVDAENDLSSLTPVITEPIVDGEEAIQFVANWWAKWYPTAGHKRLARILLQYKSKEGKK